MIVAISSILLLVFFLGIVIAEKKESQRTEKTIKRTNKVIADLESSVVTRYRDKFGKDPTGQIPLLDKDKL